MKPYKLISTIAIMVYLFCGISIASADNLVWQTSKNTAVSIAKSEGKYILLLTGRETCGNCQYMQYTACESASPPIKDLIEHSFVPWFCDVDDPRMEWHVYASDLGSFYLPMICVIDPNDQDNYLDRTTGVQNLQTFYDRLLQYSAPDSDGDGIPDSLEETGCTNSIDADTDDDGIIDGDEDLNRNGLVDSNETDPCDPDTDGDGLQDGTEMGYILDDIGPDTDLNIFIPDEDPDTTTDPLNEDSDGDGCGDAFDGRPNNPHWVTIGGSASLVDGTPIVAMVLANGQYMFSNNPVGEYILDVPLNPHGEITLYAFCGGQEPFKTTLTPTEAFNYEIIMEAASPDSQQMIVTAEMEESTLKSGWVHISGQVTTEEEIPLSAMVLANGKQQFSNDPIGYYALDVPLNPDGNITLYVFGGGQAPFKTILPFD